MSNFDGMLFCDHTVFIHETIFSCWANFQVFEFISIVLSKMHSNEGILFFLKTGKA